MISGLDTISYLWEKTEVPVDLPKQELGFKCEELIHLLQTLQQSNALILVFKKIAEKNWSQVTKDICWFRNWSWFCVAMKIETTESVTGRCLTKAVKSLA